MTRPLTSPSQLVARLQAADPHAGEWILNRYMILHEEQMAANDARLNNWVASSLRQVITSAIANPLGTVFGPKAAGLHPPGYRPLAYNAHMMLAIVDYCHTHTGAWGLIADMFDDPSTSASPGMSSP